MPRRRSLLEEVLSLRRKLRYLVLLVLVSNVVSVLTTYYIVKESAIEEIRRLHVMKISSDIEASRLSFINAMNLLIERKAPTYVALKAIDKARDYLRSARGSILYLGSDIIGEDTYENMLSNITNINIGLAAIRNLLKANVTIERIFKKAREQILPHYDYLSDLVSELRKKLSS